MPSHTTILPQATPRQIDGSQQQAGGGAAENEGVAPLSWLLMYATKFKEAVAKKVEEIMHPGDGPKLSPAEAAAMAHQVTAAAIDRALADL